VGAHIVDFLGGDAPRILSVGDCAQPDHDSA